MGQAVAYESVAKRSILAEEIRKMDKQARRMDSEYSAGLIDSASFSHDRLILTIDYHLGIADR